MRITFVLPPLNYAGGIRSNAELAAALQRRGHDVLAVFPPRPKPPLRRSISGFVKGKGWPKYVRRAPSYWDHCPVPQHELDRNRPVTSEDVPDADVVVATWWETAEWVARMPPQKGARAYMIRHHEALTCREPGRAAATYRLPFHKVAISKWLIDVMKDTYGDADVSLVPNSVDAQVFKSPVRERSAGATVGLMVADDPLKGTTTSIAVLEQVRAAIPNLTVIAFGFKRPQIPLPDFYEFVEDPPLAKIPELYSRCDAFLYTSTAEGFGRPALEAMACRCPLVSTEVGGPSDFVKNGENGFISPVDDVKDLSERLTQVLSLSPEAWRNMSEAAFVTATGYTWDDAGERMERALERAVERRRLGQI